MSLGFYLLHRPSKIFLHECTSHTDINNVNAVLRYCRKRLAWNHAEVQLIHNGFPPKDYHPLGHYCDCIFCFPSAFRRYSRFRLSPVDKDDVTIDISRHNLDRFVSLYTFDPHLEQYAPEEREALKTFDHVARSLLSSDEDIARGMISMFSCLEYAAYTRWPWNPIQQAKAVERRRVD